MHQEMIDAYGGSLGVRDMGALEAAVARPQSGYYEGRIEEAAALMESLLLNHPFIDGNKRAAFASVDVFLGKNNYMIIADSKTIETRLLGLFEAGQVNYETLLALLREITENVDE